MSVLVCGDREKPALITYPDVALNCKFVTLFILLLFLIWMDLLTKCSMSCLCGLVKMFRIRSKATFCFCNFGLLYNYHNLILAFSADVSCFQGLLFCPEAASLLLHNFCIYHIDAPGHEVGIISILPLPSNSYSQHRLFHFILKSSTWLNAEELQLPWNIYDLALK